MLKLWGELKKSMTTWNLVEIWRWVDGNNKVIMEKNAK
jgi:hypothetical protein